MTTDTPTLPGDPFEAFAPVNKTRAQGPTFYDSGSQFLADRERHTQEAEHGANQRIQAHITKAQAGFLKDTERFQIFKGGHGYPRPSSYEAYREWKDNSP